ncbi:MAG: hypothetical protein J6386_13060 [Candidatus Synoicihabitans palmerolidicus]|nr:hypothetical protein [Candidatus Synoicihabitans palmerolidicus]
MRATKLMKWEAFNTADFSNLKTLFRPQYVSYLRPEDRPILMGLLQLTKRDGQFPPIDGAYGHEVFHQMLATRRLFFDGGSRLRLKPGDPLSAALDWEQRSGNSWQPIATIPTQFRSRRISSRSAGLHRPHHQYLWSHQSR